MKDTTNVWSHPEADLGGCSPAHSFQTLMAKLQAIARNTCRTSVSVVDAPTFVIITTSNPKQKRALDLIDQISP